MNHSETVETPETMNAMVYEDYGDASVLHQREVPIPERLPGQVLIDVRASSVNPIDYRIRSGELKGLLPGGFPRIPGYDVAGVIVDCAGDGPFAVGDRVVAFLDTMRGGACADFAVAAIDVTAAIPDSMSFNEAAAIPLAGTTALQSLRDHGGIAKGKQVLINGASGGVGMFAVQIAKSFDCHVDAVASGDNEEYCRSLGADHFYNYETTDFTTSSERWDLIFDAAGKSGYWDVKQVLKEGGRYVSTEPDVKGMLMTLVTWPLSKSGTVMLAKPNADDLRTLIALHQKGQLQITIDAIYPFSQLSQAHQHVENGVERGKVVLTADGSGL
ncbi:NAD(P)-dependent alcohol dehydrogenase [Rhodopirellula sp. P2]|uniref:NAD(P)-dependent alcohol dehydrogenase n=1 Tax=Rhodopirellula sp. P2 TaxID=2127060 RepID=UPI0023681906|nr:NAD(P)-dependent alcohol dehydrogenase [Rhodopirellula sp. P2]WDQ15018.1 NAD(P)-dependent alcohol dehydrogenase [Rhodopirellula sp. P2]